jgi:hypothetical protein
MKLTNPWKILEEKKIYENAWIRVDEFQVIHPGGSPGIYGKVTFRNKAIEMVMNNEITDSLSIAGLLKAGRILGC